MKPEIQANPITRKGAEFSQIVELIKCDLQKHYSNMLVIQEGEMFNLVANFQIGKQIKRNELI